MNFQKFNNNFKTNKEPIKIRKEKQGENNRVKLLGTTVQLNKYSDYKYVSYRKT